MGGVLSAARLYRHVYGQMFPSDSPTFRTQDIPDLTGRVAIVTGGNRGIGKEIVRVLLVHNATVYMASRNVGMATAAIEELKALTGNEALLLELDLSNLESIRAAAQQFMAKEQDLHILINNAGVSSVPQEWITKDGYDMQFGTNVLGPHLFTKNLLPALARGASSSPDFHSRVIWASSSSAYMVPKIFFDTLKDGKPRKKLPHRHLYAQSKLANLILARQYAKRFSDKSIVSIAVNPGNIKTEVMRNASLIQRKWINALLLRYPVQYGALTPLWAATMPETLHFNGQFLVPWVRVTDIYPEQALDERVGEQLWNWLEEQINTDDQN